MQSSVTQISAPSSVPVGAKIVSVFYYLVSIPLIALGILYLVVGTFLFDFDLFWLVLAGLGFLASIIMIVAGLLFFLTGRWLWQGKSKGRTIAIILSSLALLNIIISAVQVGQLNIVSLAINALILVYLSFSPRIKATFSGS